MTEKRSNKFMLDLLKKVQPMQIEALKKGYDVYIDGSISNLFDGTDHIYFDVTIFEETNIKAQYNFYYNHTEEQLEVTLAKLRADINALQLRIA